MAEPFLSEIRLFSFNWPPKGWAFCNGQLLPINQNQALFALLGTTYGGNGSTNFALPDMRGRAPIHFSSQALPLGTKGGEEAHTLTQQELPQHSHLLQGQTTEVLPDVGPQDPAGKVFASASVALQGGNKAPVQLYSNHTQALVPMNSTGVSNVGGSQAHENMSPFLTLNFCIALQGIFPSQN